MNNTKGKFELAATSWLIAFAGGTLAGTLLWLLGGWGFLQASFVGAVLFVVVGALLSLMMMRPLPGPGEFKINPGPVKAAPAPTVPASDPDAAPVVIPVPKTAVAKPKTAAPKPVATKTPAPKVAKAEEAAPASDEKPALMLDAPKDGQADDLKKISGVGPKLEETLNSLGIWHYEQVASLKKKDIAWVDERLRFKGRIERDDWVGQAKALAEAKG